MHRLLLVFTAICCLFLACESAVDLGSGDRIKVDVNTKRKAVLSNSFNVNKVIPLDASEKLLGHIVEIKQYHDKLYIATASKGNGLFIFDLRGKYLGQFGTKGNGPREYRYIQSFVIHKDQVYVLDRDAQRIDLYDLDGRFLKSLIKGVHGFDMALFRDELIVYAGNTYLENEGQVHKLHYYDLDGRFLRSEQDIDQNQAEFLNLIPQKVFSSNQQLYLEPFSTTIYQSTDSGLQQWKKLDFGRHTFNESELDRTYENVAQFINNVRTQDYAIFLSNLRENSRWLSFGYEYKEPAKPCLVLVDKDSEAIRVYDQLTEDMLTDGALLSFKQFKLTGTHENQFIFSVNPNDLIESGKVLDGEVVEAESNPIIYLMSIAE